MSRSSVTLADVPGLDRYDRTTRRVIVLVGVALALRLAFLGSRVAHFDEGRVGWWAINLLETGTFEYRDIIHGPLMQHVDATVFMLLGANDFTMRLPVALIGGVLPLSALLYREHLDGDEVVAVAFFLALNPILVYYSRFFRSTIPVAAFAFVTFGFLVRAYDERSMYYAYPAAIFAALAFASKENAVVYLLCWIGGIGLLVDHALFRSGDDRSGFDWAAERLRANRERAARVRADWDYYAGHAVLAAFLFCLLTLYFYAPRSPDSGVGLWGALADPTRFPALVETTYDAIAEGYGSWFGKSEEVGQQYDGQIDQYESYLGTALDAMKRFALPLSVLSVFGFVFERYARDRPRFLVLFAGYWGFVSVLGYPYGTDIASAWIMVNAIVPLAIPAGVGLAVVVRWGRRSIGGDPVLFGLVLFALLVIFGQMGVAMAQGVYLNPTGEDNEMVQYAQPADDFRPAMRFVEGSDHAGTDVLFVGDPYVRDSPRAGLITPYCLNMGNALPLHWYVEIYDADAACEQDADAALANMSAHDPQVVVTSQGNADAIASELPGAEVETHRIRAWGRPTSFIVRRGGGSVNAGNEAVGNETTDSVSIGDVTSGSVTSGSVTAGSVSAGSAATGSVIAESAAAGG